MPWRCTDSRGTTLETSKIFHVSDWESLNEGPVGIFGSHVI